MIGVAFNFGIALKFLKDGRKVCRKGWNGENMFIYYVPSSSYPARTDIAKEEFGDMVEYRGYLAMKTAQGDVVPWTASQTDILSEDWHLAYGFEEYADILKSEGAF